VHHHATDGRHEDMKTPGPYTFARGVSVSKVTGGR
jgi:hypothetical protein